MDNDSFYPAFVTAAKIIGLGEVIVKQITVRGIKLIEEKGLAEPNAIRWFNTLLNKTLAEIVAWGNEKTHAMQMATGLGQTWGPTSLTMTASNNEPEQHNGFTLGLVPRTAPNTHIGRTLFDSSMQSMFMQLPIAKWPFGAQVEINWGYTTVTFASVGATLSNGVGILPNFETNRTPSFVACQPLYGPGYALPIVMVPYEIGVNWIAVQGICGYAGVPGPITIGFLWVAIG